MPNKVLFLNASLYTGRYSFGGLEKMFIWVANSLADQGVDVTICTLYDEEKNPKISSRVNTFLLGAKYESRFLIRTTRLFTQIRHRLKGLLKGYDVVVSFGDISYYVAVTLKRSCNFRLVLSERCDPNNKGSLLSKFGLKLYRYADAVVFQSNGAQSYFDDTIKQKSFVIPNATVIPEQKWSGIERSWHIAYVGRIDFRQKRLDVLIKAFSCVLKEYPNLVLDIYGDGELKHLEELSIECKITQNVIIHGVVSDVNNRLLKSDMLVVTSDFEGIPNALLEAMSLGMPVVSTNCSPGGAAMLIDNHINGILVERGDVEQVAKGILFMLDNWQSAVTMAANTREKMKEFDPQKIAMLWERAICQN